MNIRTYLTRNEIYEDVEHQPQDLGHVGLGLIGVSNSELVELAAEKGPQRADEDAVDGHAQQAVEHADDLACLSDRVQVTVADGGHRSEREEDGVVEVPFETIRLHR